MFNRWLVKESPATLTMAWSLLGTPLGSLDATTEGLIEGFGVVGIGFSSEDVGMGEVCTGLEEELDEGDVGTNGEMLTDLVPDGEGEEGWFGIICATVVVVVVLVVAKEGLGLVVVGLGVVVVVDFVGMVAVMAGVAGMVDIMAGIAGMVAVIAGVVGMVAGFGTASAVVDFPVEFISRLVVALVVKSFCKVVSFVIVEVVEMETLASEADSSVILDEEPSGEDWEALVSESWRSTNSLVRLLYTSSDSVSANRSLKFVTFPHEEFWVLFGQLIRKHRDFSSLTIAVQDSPSGQSCLKSQSPGLSTVLLTTILMPFFKCVGAHGSTMNPRMGSRTRTGWTVMIIMREKVTSPTFRDEADYSRMVRPEQTNTKLIFTKISVCIDVNSSVPKTLFLP